jgi:hypothetical protein
MILVCSGVSRGIWSSERGLAVGELSSLGIGTGVESKVGISWE